METRTLAIPDEVGHIPLLKPAEGIREEMEFLDAAKEKMIASLGVSAVLLGMPPPEDPPPRRRPGPSRMDVEHRRGRRKKNRSARKSRRRNR